MHGVHLLDVWMDRVDTALQTGQPANDVLGETIFTEAAGRGNYERRPTGDRRPGSLVRSRDGDKDRLDLHAR